MHNSELETVSDHLAITQVAKMIFRLFILVLFLNKLSCQFMFPGPFAYSYRETSTIPTTSQKISLKVKERISKTSERT